MKFINNTKMEIKKFKVVLVDGTHEYPSKWNDYSEKIHNDAIDLIKKAAGGDLSVLIIHSDYRTYIFPKQVIERSILVIKYE